MDTAIVATIATAVLGLASAFLGSKWGLGKGKINALIDNGQKVFTEANEAVETIQKALEDNKLSKEELENVMKEVKDVVNSIKAITRPTE